MRKSSTHRNARLTLLSLFLLSLVVAGWAYAEVKPAKPDGPMTTETLAALPTEATISSSDTEEANEAKAGVKHWTDPEYIDIFQGAAARFPRPGGSQCPKWTCGKDTDCGDECTVPNCPWPCGVCVWETSVACSGVCVCR